MTKLLRIYPDVERLVVDVLTPIMSQNPAFATVGVGLPASWKPDTSAPHVQVAVDMQALRHPIAARTTVRVAVWAGSTTRAKQIANLAQMILLMASVVMVPPCPCQSLTGVVAGRDPDNLGEFAWFTVALTVRSIEAP